MEDAAYVKLLNERIAQARADKRNEAADHAQSVLDDIWQNVYPTHADYRPTYEQLKNARTKVAQAIITLEQETPLASNTNP